jgi:hypothetical protein
VDRRAAGSEGGADSERERAGWSAAVRGKRARAKQALVDCRVAGQ